MTDKPRWTRDWEPFLKEMEARLQAGYERYGDGSFERTLSGPDGLLAMVEEELLDIVGWGYINWTRLRRLRQLVESWDEGSGLTVEL